MYMSHSVRAGDITISMNGIEIGKTRSISYELKREVEPVYTLGSAYPRTVTRSEVAYGSFNCEINRETSEKLKETAGPFDLVIEQNGQVVRLRDIQITDMSSLGDSYDINFIKYYNDKVASKTRQAPVNNEEAKKLLRKW